MAKLKIAGGSDSFTNNEERRNGLRYLQNNIPTVSLSSKTSPQGYILPAFNSNMSPRDTQYAVSHEAYRIPGTIDRDTNEPKFSAWYYTLPCYDFFGKDFHSFVSPAAFGMGDPINDIRRYIYRRRKYDSDAQFMHLVSKDYWTNQDDKNDFKKKVALPNTQNLTFINVWSNSGSDKDTEFKNRVLILRPGAAKELFKTLNTERSMRDGAATDMLWPDYKIGDITNPEAAPMFSTKMIPTETNANIQFPVLSFGSTPTYNKLTDDMLRGRYALDDDNVLYVPSYEEIVQILVDNEEVPYELIRQVCKNNCAKFPERPATIYTPAEAPAQEPQTYQAYNEPAAAPAPAVAPTPTAAPAPTVPAAKPEVNAVLDKPAAAEWTPKTDPIDFGGDDIPMGDADDIKPLLVKALRGMSSPEENSKVIAWKSSHSAEEFLKILTEAKAECK